MQTTDWPNFETRLAAYLAAMDGDDHLIVEVPTTPEDDGARPYAQVCVADGLFAEVAGNAVLLPGHRLSEDALERLSEDGWRSPDEDTPNLWRHETDPGELARAIAEALAEAYAVAHPSLLSARAWGGPAARRVRTLRLPPAPVEAESAVLVPSGRDHLLAMVEQALDGVDGVAPERDADGDFVVDDDGVRMYVRVRPDASVLTVFSVAIRRVRSRKQAALELATLNRPGTVGRYLLVGESVILMVDVPARPFVPEHLRRTLRDVRAQAQRDCGGLTLRVEATR